MSHKTAKEVLGERLGPLFGDAFLDDLIRQEQERGYNFATLDSEAWAERCKIIAAEIKSELSRR